jgi:hypothetical protein
MIKHTNNSLIHSSNFSQINTYYLSFSSELTCRYSISENTTICFYYPSSIIFNQIEHHFDKITNVSHTRQRLIITFIIISILVVIVRLFALYILCTSRLPFQSMIQLDYIIDPKLAREAALKLAPEPV